MPPGRGALGLRAVHSSRSREVPSRMVDGSSTLLALAATLTASLLAYLFLRVRRHVGPNLMQPASSTSAEADHVPSTQSEKNLKPVASSDGPPAASSGSRPVPERADDPGQCWACSAPDKRGDFEICPVCAEIMVTPLRFCSAACRESVRDRHEQWHQECKLMIEGACANESAPTDAEGDGEEDAFQQRALLVEALQAMAAQLMADSPGRTTFAVGRETFCNLVRQIDSQLLQGSEHSRQELENMFLASAKDGSVELRSWLQQPATIDFFLRVHV